MRDGSNRVRDGVIVCEMGISCARSLSSDGSLLKFYIFVFASETERFLLTFESFPIMMPLEGIYPHGGIYMNRKPYSSAIKKTPFKYPIAKKIAKLMLDGKEYSEIYEECYTNNYIEIESPDRRREITNVIYGRLSALDPYLLSEFYNGDVATSKFILAYSIAKTDTLFFDFMAEIYREALLGDKHYLSIDDFDNFFAVKKQSDLIVAKWGDFTLHCLTKGYRNILVDSGLGIRERRTIKVERMMIHPNVEEYIASIGDKEYLQAMLGR